MTTKDRDVTEVVLLGTGTPVTDPRRQGPATAIVVGEAAYLVDFGPGVVRRAAEAHAAGVRALEPRRLTRAFVTHLHSDHTAGLPDLVLTPWVMGREQPLLVRGPEGTERMTRHVLQAYREDVRVRTHGLEPANDGGHRVDARDVEPGLVYEDDHVRVEAFPVRHGDWPRAYGYAFTTHDRRIVVSGDTAPAQTVVTQARGCDVLVHEVYSAARFRHRSPRWQRYHAAYHTSTSELADIATRAGPRLLVLTHQLFWGASEEDLLAEVRAGYSGRVVSGRDLDVL